MAVVERVCTTCTFPKPLDDKNFVRHPDTGNFLQKCRECRNKQKKLDRINEKKKRKKAKVDTPSFQPRTKAEKSLRYVISYAQNATALHDGFFKTLKNYCVENDATLLVLPGRYHNPTSHWGRAAQSQDWWAAELEPFLFGGRLDLGPHLTIYGDISIQPTATRPLSSFEVFAGQASAIFGHPKIQLQAVATANRDYPRIFTSTGACTVPNYVPSKAGKKAEAHHVFGATVVERAGDRFYLRQINAEDDGSFIDLDKRYTPEGSELAPQAEALVCGDIHVAKAEKPVLDATLYADNSILKTLKPKTIVYHDVLDFDTRNHHRINDPLDRFARAIGREQDSVMAELDQAVDFLDSTPGDAEIYIIASNHDDALDRWLNNEDPRKDPRNARIFHSLWTDRLTTYEDQNEWVPAFELFYRNWGGSGRARFVRRNETLKIKNIVVSFHGDKGTNGSIGTINGYARLGVKTIIGHSHTPGILDGCYQVGVTGRLDQGYNDLPSSWLHAHCLIYGNGKRTLLFVIDGKWRPDQPKQTRRKAA